MKHSFKPTTSFEILNSLSFFNKLCEEYLDFDKEHLNPRFAINAALTSWHLTDWTYQEYYSSSNVYQGTKLGNKPTMKLSEYQDYLKTLCPELEYMRQISNGSKHCKINQSFQTKVSSGDFSPYDFCRHDFAVPRFIISNENTGVEYDFEHILVTTIEFWRDYIKSLSSSE